MADRSGQQLGNYKLISLIGRGGFAEVYLGEHIRLKTQAAIKVLYTQLEHDDADQFLSEAQTIARLIHPNIVRIFDFDIRDGVPFLVMDYATNGNLRQQYPKNTRVPLTTIIPYVKQVADALQYAHDEKLIHRDIKPENMLLGRHGEVLLGDFGIALIAQSTRQSTQEVVGTAYYMAPEQLKGKPQRASDQYSLAIVVYELLTGDRPFHGSFSEIASQHMFVPPPSMREKLPSLSLAVEEVIMTALAKEAKDRFGSVRAFATALEQASELSHTALSVALPEQPSAPANAPASSSAQPYVIPSPALTSTPSTPPRQSPQATKAPANEVQAEHALPPIGRPKRQMRFADKAAANEVQLEPSLPPIGHPKRPTHYTDPTYYNQQPVRQSPGTPVPMPAEQGIPRRAPIAEPTPPSHVAGQQPLQRRTKRRGVLIGLLGAALVIAVVGVWYTYSHNELIRLAGLGLVIAVGIGLVYALSRNDQNKQNP